MLRDIRLSEVSDGKLYGINDMAKTDCGGCEGCSSCCRGMGTSIVLDPYDVFRLLNGLDLTFEELLARHIDLNVADGIILPNLKMTGADEACTFLNQNGRCSIHAFRPGICRIFPLGRFYEDGSFRYFLQIHECPKPNKAKVKIRKWIDTPDIKQYETFIADWHYFLKRLQEYALQKMQEDNGQESTVKNLSLYLLQKFYIQPFLPEEDFYTQFHARLKEALEYTDQYL